MNTINIINKKDYPDIFADFFKFRIEEIYHEHRRGSNFFTQALLRFDEDNLPEHPELHGLWESDVFIHDYEYGPDVLPNELFRVEKKTRMVEETYYERVKT